MVLAGSDRVAPEQVHGVAKATQRRTCLPSASAPDVPFCAAARMAMAVILARRSVPEWVRSIADSGAGGATCSTGCQARFSMRCSRDRWPPCLLLLHTPGTTLTRVIRPLD